MPNPIERINTCRRLRQDAERSASTTHAKAGERERERIARQLGAEVLQEIPCFVLATLEALAHKPTPPHNLLSTASDQDRRDAIEKHNRWHNAYLLPIYNAIANQYPELREWLWEQAQQPLPSPSAILDSYDRPL